MTGNHHPGITVSFSDGATLHSVRFDQFTGDFPRSFADTASLSFSATGALSQTGMTRQARRMWAVGANCSEATTYALEELYLAYDAVRATGATAVVAITDETRVADINTPITANAVFTAAPAISGGRNGSPLWTVSFALTEV